MVCPKCGAQLADGVGICKYCGERFLTKNGKKKYSQNSNRQTAQDDAEAAEMYKSGVFGKVTIILFVLSVAFCIYAFIIHSVPAVIFALLQMGLLILSWLVGMRFLPEKIKGFHYIAVFAALLLIIPCQRAVIYNYGNGFWDTFGNSYYNKMAEIEWPQSDLAQMLPAPPSTYGRINTDSFDYLSVVMGKTSKEDFLAYVKECKNKGFTQEKEETGYSYSAFDKDGYELYVSYYNTDESLTIRINAPLELGSLQWSKNDITSGVPVPDSTTGKLSYETSDYYCVYVGEYDKEKYTQYVDDCIDAGFNEDYYRSEKSYRGKNKDGKSLSVIYEGNSNMCITINIDK